MFFVKKNRISYYGFADLLKDWIVLLVQEIVYTRGQPNARRKFSRVPFNVLEVNSGLYKLRE